ncbi:TPA: translation initiation factor IF-6 [Candidatus Woesearchaeota archaeon]|nr:translation initiation factor IF-6 [Candidatus Woesearchaeota archaeon]
MHVLKTNFNGSPNVGMSLYATDSFVLLGEHLQDKLTADVKNAFGDLSVHNQRIAGTGLPGVFLAGNSKTLLVPSIAFDWEIDALKKLDRNVIVLKTRHTCLGNNIACNDRGAIISSDFDETERKEIEHALGVSTICMDIAGLNTPGALIVLHGKHGIIHRDATQHEIATIEKTLGVTLSPATINLGTPYLRAGMANNSFGFVIGDQSGGPEIVHIEDSLGYLDEENDEKQASKDRTSKE